MAKNNIELNIGTKCDVSGLNTLNKHLVSASGNVKKATQAMGGVIGALGEMGGAAGKATQAIGGLIGNVMQMGVWGVALAAISASVTAVVKRFNEWRDAVEDNRKAHRALFASAIRDVEFYDARAQRSLDRRAAAEAAAADRRKEAQRKEQEEFIKRSQAAQKAVNEREANWREMNIMQMQLDQQGGSPLKNAQNAASVDVARAQSAVTGAQANLRAARRFSGEGSNEAMAAAHALEKAELELALTIKRNKEAVDAAMEATQKEAEAREAAAADAAKRDADEAKAAWARQMREEADKRIAGLRADGEKKVAEIDKKIAAERERAALLEAEASKARGKSFNQWNREMRQEARQKRKDDARKERRMRNAIGQIEILEAEQRRNGRGFNPQRAAALAKLREFVANQDPKNNPALKAAEKLEKDKMDMMAKTERAIADINQRLKDAVTL